MAEAHPGEILFDILSTSYIPPTFHSFKTAGKSRTTFAQTADFHPVSPALFPLVTWTPLVFTWRPEGIKAGAEQLNYENKNMFLQQRSLKKLFYLMINKSESFDVY